MSHEEGGHARGVSIAPLADTDGEEFIDAVRASRELHRPWMDPPDTPERYLAYLEHAARDDQAVYLFRHTACGGVVGYVSVGNIVRRSFLSAYLGYAAFAGHAGRGLMERALREVLGTAFGDLGLHRVEANIQPANVRSLALVRKLGFEREGYSPDYLMVDGAWRDHERWALRVDRWAAAGTPLGAR